MKAVNIGLAVLIGLGSVYAFQPHPQCVAPGSIGYATETATIPLPGTYNGSPLAGPNTFRCIQSSNICYWVEGDQGIRYACPGTLVQNQ